MGHITENAIKQISEAFGRRLQGEGITRIQWIALYYLKTKGKISQRDLSNFMYVKDSSIGRLIDRLEREGFVERERNNTDRRVIFINLTQKGEQLISDLMHIGVEFNDNLISGIKEEDILVFEKVLEKMTSNIQDWIK